MPPVHSLPVPARKSAVFFITSDPCASARPAEGLRIAAGLWPWRKIDLRVYLHDAVVSQWRRAPHLVRDEASFRQCLPLLSEDGAPGVLVSQSLAAACPSLLVDPVEIPLHGVSDDALGALAARSDWILRF